VEAKPIAQAFVLRWVLMGGMSTNRFFGMAWWPCPGASTAPVPLSPVLRGAGRGCWERAGAWVVRVVFGTLLGPEATGPGSVVFWLRGPVLVCFWFPGCISSCAVAVPFLRGWFCAGVCGAGLLFENYIVDASI
jgi:hypothetical protein